MCPERSPDTRGCLLERTLDTQLRLLELVRRRVLDLELLERARELCLDLGFRASLELHPDLGARDRALDLVDIRLEVRLGVVPRAKVLVCLLELFCVLNHLVDLGPRETPDRVCNAWDASAGRVERTGAAAY